MAVSDKSKVAAVIPARYASTRFPGKPLVKIGGVTMIERTYKQALQAKNIDRVIVATDDERIRQVVQGFGGECVMTRDDHPTGTDRLAEVALLCPEIDIIVNVQGDEPLIDPGVIEAVAKPLINEPGVEMATAVFRVTEAEAQQSNLVKAVFDQSGFAMYFSRHPIPFHREEKDPVQYYGHMGLYAYTKDCLLKLAKLKPTPVEQVEKLEQLRALESGIRIRIVEFDARPLAVDVPEDVAKVEQALSNFASYNHAWQMAPTVRG